MRPYHALTYLQLLLHRSSIVEIDKHTLISICAFLLVFITNEEDVIKANVTVNDAPLTTFVMC